jgi:hypothetical protein
MNDEPGEDDGGKAEVLPGYEHPSDDGLSDEAKARIEADAEPVEPTE